MMVSPSPSRLLASLVVLLGLLVPTLRAACETYQGGICQDIASRYPAKVYVSSSQAAIENQLVNIGFKNFTLNGIYFPACRFAAEKFTCGFFFPQCDSNNTYPIFPCRSVCEEYASTCSFIFNNSTIKAPNCAIYATTNCASMQSMTYEVPNPIVCPDPLLPNPNPGTVTPDCPGGLCCYPCPRLDIFYPKGVFFAYQTTATVLVSVAGLCTFFVFVTYLVLPEKRTMSHLTVISISAALSLGYLSGWMTIIPGRVESFCFSETERSYAPNSNTLCIVQGSLWVFATLASSFWFFCLALNIHLIIIWKIHVGWKLNMVYNLLCWGLPTLAIILLNAYQLIDYSAGATCNVTPLYLNQTLNIPIAVSVFPAILLNIFTFARVGYVAHKLRAPIRKILELQFRPLLYSISIVTVAIISWSFIAATIGKYDDLTWVTAWSACIAYGQGQDECSKIANGHLLDLGGFMASYVFSALLGFTTLVTFGLKEDVISGWVRVISGAKVGSTAQTSSKGSRMGSIAEVGRVGSVVEMGIPKDI